MRGVPGLPLLTLLRLIPYLVMPLQVAHQLRSKMEDFQTHMPLIIALRCASCALCCACKEHTLFCVPPAFTYLMRR